MGQKPQNMGQVVFRAIRVGFGVYFFFFLRNYSKQLSLAALVLLSL